ncbi:Branched-chain amino acid ABC transporter, amino acid-binding protein (TC 3.A.1.4.1) [hydrothermal vent metagenome]|uniref:Branched-chain amino acid ABC transporter, amino acid-binding protein (TC 3.A.1.4.1) n=1 Tax=hydrothermal vent metagenome TaxID=652676 RepID=A0A3B0UAN3_9ZZZZ
MQNFKKTLLTAIALSALGAASPAMAQVKLGFLGGFTGPIESLTPPIFAGAKLAVHEINAQGGILDGKTLELIAGDSTCADATAAANAADKEINTDNVSAIVGPMCSGATISAANNAGIPGNTVMISPSATAPSVSDVKDNDLLFRTAPSDAYQGDVLARLLLSKGIDNIAITYVNNDYGKGLADALSAAFEKNGGTVAISEGHEEGKADYRAELGSLAASGAQTLVVLAYANGSGQTILRQAVEAGDFTQFVGGDGMVSNELLKGIDASAVNGMIATKPGTPDLPGASIYSILASAEGLDPTAIFAPQAYDATFILALAIEQKGSADRDGMSKAVRAVATAPGEVILPGEWSKAVKLLAAGKDINYEGASGQQEFDAVGDVPGTIVEMKVENGAFVEVGPAK